MLSMSAGAEDIELYVNHNVQTNEKPRVIMIFDTSGSMAWDVADGDPCYQWDGVERTTPRFSRITCFESNVLFSDQYQCYKKESSFQGIRSSRFYNGTQTSGYDYDSGYPVASCEDSRLRVAQNAITQLVN
ncbi:MAG: pilin biogenesis protein, partial [Pseudoalteromonas tetraodonis]